MNKLSRAKSRKSLFYLLAMIYFSINTAPAHAWSTLGEYKSSASKNLTLNINDTITQQSSNITYVKEFSATAAVVWEYHNIDNLEGLIYVGGQVFDGKYTSAVDTGKSITYGGIKYYRYAGDLNKLDSDMYVAVEQHIWDNGNDVDGKYFIPYKKDNNSGITVNYFKRTCSFNWKNSDDQYLCRNDNSGNMMLEITQAASVSGRSGKIYFYLPKMPTQEVTFNNVHIATTSIASAASDVSWEKSTEVASNSNGTPVFDFYLNGSLRFDNSCKIDGPVAIEVPMGALSSIAFTTKGAPPAGFTPKANTLKFVCAKSIPNSYGGMKWSITPTAASDGSGTEGVLLAKPVGANTIEGLGVKITSDAAGNKVIPLRGLQEAPISGSSKNVATATFYAYPTMLTDRKPSGGGDYSDTATVTFDVP
jgi:hypothetical protein